jgi:CBS domain-containing protein
MKTVRDILESKPQEVWSTSPKARVFDALKLMSEKNIGALMVMDERGKVVGIFSERDYARKVILLGKSSKKTSVEEIMTSVSHMFCVSPVNTVEECMFLMTRRQIRHLPVFAAGVFLGIISIGDVVKSVITEKEYLIDQLSNSNNGKWM